MRITPLDIRKQEFRKTMRGLDSDEVYAFLITVADEYEAVLSDNKRLREHIVQLEERLTEFKSMETNLRNTLMTAEKVTADAKENARKEADLIVRGAEVEAVKSAEAIRAHTQQLRREILELKKHKDNYVTRLRTLLDSHRSVIDGFEEDFAEVDREIEAIGRKVEEDVQTPPPASRMSRERIEEDFAHEETGGEGPEDKVTWGDDQPRKDVERPTVPRPGEWEQKDRERWTTAPEDRARDTEEKAEQKREEETASSEQLDFGPVGEMSQEDVVAAASSAADDSEEEYHDDREEMTEDELEGEALARDVVAHSIEERMYPDAHLNGKSPAAEKRGIGGAPQASAAPQQMPPSQGSPTASSASVPGTAAGSQAPQATMPAGEHAKASATGTAVHPDPAVEQAEESAAQKEARDDWKSYEVNEKRQDWSSYEVPRQERAEDQQAAQPVPKPAAPTPMAQQGPSDKEVENALSGLTEAVPEQPEKNAPEANQQAQPKAAAPADAADRSAQTAGPAEASSETQEESSGEGQKWSMEELRKNLTNMDRDS
jgi:cell division initiation protein